MAERMNDGVSASFSFAVRYVFNNAYYDRWTGIGGPFV
jgi:hypothetical protein